MVKLTRHVKRIILILSLVALHGHVYKVKKPVLCRKLVENLN